MCGQEQIQVCPIDGHFAAWEEPSLFTVVLRAASRSFRY